MRLSFLKNRKAIKKWVSGTVLFFILLGLILFMSPFREAIALGTGLSLELGWSSSQADNTSSMAWGDFDNDGDLDLVAGNLSFFDNYNYLSWLLLNYSLILLFSSKNNQIVNSIPQSVSIKVPS